MSSPASPLHPQHHRALFMLVLATVFWAGSFPMVKTMGMIQLVVDPGSTSWFVAVCTVAPRFFLAALILGCWHGRTWLSVTGSELRQGLCLGGFSLGGMLLQNLGLQYTEATTSAFLTQIFAVMIPLYMALRWKRRLGWRVWVAVGGVLVGVALLGKFDPRHLRLGFGETLTVLCSFFFMAQILALELPQYRANRAWVITGIMFAVQGVVGGGLMIGLAPADATWGILQSASWWSLTGVLTVSCTLVTFLLMATWQPKITATEAGLIYCAEPLWTALISLLLPSLLAVWCGVEYANETLTPTLLWGGGLILASNILVQLAPPAPRAAPQDQTRPFGETD